MIRQPRCLPSTNFTGCFAMSAEGTCTTSKSSDDAGRLRVIFPTPNWDDFVQLACREIRLYGAGNFQIARRFRAMIDNLMKALPESRRPALRLELELLDRTIEKLYHLPSDIALARIADTQGLGGSSSAG